MLRSNKQPQIYSLDKSIGNPEVTHLEVVKLIIANSKKSMLISCSIALLLVYLQADVTSFHNILKWSGILLLAHLIKKITGSIYLEKNRIKAQFQNNS